MDLTLHDSQGTAGPEGVVVGAENEPAAGLSGDEVGVLPLDKPAGPSSFKMVGLVRRAMGIKKVGHSGTLDPFASGLLVICIGRPATRIISTLMGGEKEYEVAIRLGIETDTMDPEGQVIRRREVGPLSRDQVVDCLAGFVGEQLQTPPAFSALKHKGKPLYHYARKGIMVEKEPRPVVISGIELLDLEKDRLAFRVVCGKGTYIRSLASDIGNRLGCGAYVEYLRRLRNGQFSVKEALRGDLLTPDHHGAALIRSRMLPVAEVLGRISAPSPGRQYLNI